MTTDEFPFVSIDRVESVRAALARIGLLLPDEVIQGVGCAGQGNMNLVLRVTTNRRWIVVKQSRPWVARYPDLAAPVERIIAEIGFYKRVGPYPAVADWMPRMLGCDASAFLMVMEDLGASGDFSDLYVTRDVDALPVPEIVCWLARLHSIPLSATDRDGIGCRELRELNHAHIFRIPLQSPSAIALDRVCDGLEDVAAEVRSDRSIHRAAGRLGETYLGTGPVLLHGDFYPGSLLRTSQGVRVIDPEFCFAGPAEFDLGVLAAHRVLIGGRLDSVDLISETYLQTRNAQLDPNLIRGFAGIEIIRRLIGVAQLPLELDIAERRRLIDLASELLR